MRYLTAGESHGEALVTILEGIPSGLLIREDSINSELSRRMKGYGRGARMQIEKDKAHILSGVRKGRTLGSPIALLIKNRDFKINSLTSIFKPRPGHADLAGALKFGDPDMRNILERASARETAVRVAAGAIAKSLLKEFRVDFMSHVVRIGGLEVEGSLPFRKACLAAERSPVRCIDKDTSYAMCRLIENAKRQGDTLGGVFEIIIQGVVPGIGSFVQRDKRLGGKLAMSLMSIPGVKGVEIGAGFLLGELHGSTAHDEIVYDRKKKRYLRKTNRAGGIEGGMSNGEDIILRAAMKPIATLKKALLSVDVRTKKNVKAQVERADVCVVPSAGVIGESVCAIAIAGAMTEKFGGDSLSEMKRNYEGYLKAVSRL
ncbi:MAG: chorismate synthase [Candidatus Omnitrophica bacterium]|nr:chorismate synthase [Candidatus Omnitrophota bacterium]